VSKYAEGYVGPEVVDDEAVAMAIGKLHQAKVLTEQAKVLTEDAYNILAPNYLVTGAAGLQLPGVGSVDVFQGSQSRMDPKRFGELLVLQFGVPAENVAAARDAATVKTENKKLTVKFKPEK
jgi:hypothetical protein